MLAPVSPVTPSPFSVFSPACFQSTAFPFVVPLVVLPCSGGFSYGQEHCQNHVFSSREPGSSSHPNHMSVQWGRSSIFAVSCVVFFCFTDNRHVSRSAPSICCNHWPSFTRCFPVGARG